MIGMPFSLVVDLGRFFPRKRGETTDGAGVLIRHGWKRVTGDWRRSAEDGVNRMQDSRCKVMLNRVDFQRSLTVR